MKNAYSISRKKKGTKKRKVKSRKSFHPLISTAAAVFLFALKIRGGI